MKDISTTEVVQWDLSDADKAMHSLKNYGSNGARTAKDSRPSPKRELLFLPLYIGVFAVIYASTVLVPYAAADSYDRLSVALQGQLQANDYWVITGGRPILAFLTHMLFSAMGGVNDLRYAKVLAVVGLGVLAWAFYQALRMVGIQQRYALLIPVLICTLPGYELDVALPICAFYPLVSALSGVAFFSLDRAIDRGFSKRGALFALASVGLLSIAMMTYQPAAMVYWVFAGIFLLCRRSSLKSLLVRFVIYGLALVPALAMDILAIKLLPGVLYPNLAGGDTRASQLATDPLERIHWFLRTPLVDALNLWYLEPRVRIAALVGVFAFVGLFFFLKGEWAERSGKFVIALVLLPLAYLPSLVFQQEWGWYRTEVAMTSLLVIYVACAVLGCFHSLSLQKGTVATALLIMAALVGSIGAANNVTRYIVLPEAQEYGILVNQLRSPALATATSIYFISPDCSQGVSPLIRYDEFGLPSTCQPWGPPAMVYLILRQINPAKATIPVILAPPGGPYAPPSGSLVIDMRMLSSYQT
ncbi:MAG TPA: hypothetical protein VH540_05200 [Ktedonobacterales bacterium]